MAKADKLLQKAIDNLKINDVYLHASRSHCADDFEPKNITELNELLVQQMHVVTKSEIILLEENTRLLRIFIRLGTRWIEPAQEESTKINALIEADFVAEYQMLEELEQNCIDAFSQQNASYHVWPYWREYLSSQSEKMRLPRITLPAVQFSK